MKLMTYLLIFIILPSVSFARYGERVSQLAEDYKEYLEGDRLYGETFRDQTTNNGILACARVVQIILKKASVPGFQSPLYSVAQIQHKTKNWKTVQYDDLQPGDVVFWRKAGHDETCAGGGDCHVGIAVGNGQSFDNNGIWRTPEISGIAYRLRWRFMYGKRMP